MLEIYNLISYVTVTSFQMESTPNLDIISARSSGLCVCKVSLLYITALRRYRHICKGEGGNYMPPHPPAAGGWRGGPAAGGLRGIGWMNSWPMKIKSPFRRLVAVGRRGLTVCGVTLSVNYEYCPRRPGRFEGHFPFTQTC